MDNQPITPPQPLPEQQVKSNLVWLKTLSIGFSLVSFGIAIGIVGYALTINKNQPAPQNQQVVSPTIDPTANWKIYEDLKFLNYSIKYPNDWRKEDNCAFGNDCFASQDQKGINEGIGGGYDMQKGILISVSLLGSDTAEKNYYYIVCNQKGEIKGNGFNTCSATIFNSIDAIKLESDYGKNGYIHTIFDVTSKKIRLSTLSLPDEPSRKTVTQILSTFKFTDRK